MTFRAQLAQLGWVLLDAFFPRFCAVCRRQLDFHEHCVCAPCALALPRYDPLYVRAEERLYGSPLFRTLSAVYTYQPRSTSSHIALALKYWGERSVAPFVVRTAVTEGRLAPELAAVDAIIPVPIDPKRLEERGYNQAELLARALSKELHVPYLTNVCLRYEGGHAQKELTRRERMRNASSAFYLTADEKKRSALAGKKLLLVDDIMTTGATLLALCDLLEGCGVSEVHVFVISVALKRGM